MNKLGILFSKENLPYTLFCVLIVLSVGSRIILILR